MTILRVFLPFAVGFFLSYIYRVVNAVIAPDLIADLGFGPSDLGLLTAIYFISFASSQLPLGVLLDRFGPKKVESILLLFAGLGAFLFSRADTLTGLIIGRALIGFGVSACLMAAFKAYTLWFPSERLPLVNGFQMAAGGLGALAATSPVELLLQYTDWRTVFAGLAALTLIVASAIFFVVPEKHAASQPEGLQSQMRGMRQIFTSKDFWCLAPLTTVSQAAFLSIQGLWTGPWLTHVGQLDRTAVADVLFWIAVSMIAGFVLIGSLTEKLSKRGVSVTATAVSGMTLFIIVQLLLVIGPVSWAFPLWLSFGFLGTSGIIAYPALCQSFPTSLSGRVITTINLLVFLAAFVTQWAIGKIISLCSGQSSGAYSAVGFNTAFSLLIMLELGTLIFFLVRRSALRNIGSDLDLTS